MRMIPPRVVGCILRSAVPSLSISRVLNHHLKIHIAPSLCAFSLVATLRKNMTTIATSGSPDPETPIVYSIHGSQFAAKVLSALQHRKIPHYIKVSLQM